MFNASSYFKFVLLAVAIVLSLVLGSEPWGPV
jgi:hypothetical protein